MKQAYYVVIYNVPCKCLKSYSILSF